MLAMTESAKPNPLIKLLITLIIPSLNLMKLSDPENLGAAGAIPFLLVLFGVLGGLLAFGLVGLFAGPIVLAVAWAVWREWTAHLDEDAAGESS